MKSRTVCGISTAVILWSVVLADTIMQVIRAGPVHWPDVATTFAMLVAAVTVSLVALYLHFEDQRSD